MKKHRALIPLDGSSFSAQVLPAVCRLLDPSHYHLTLVRVAPPPADLSPQPTPPRPVSVDGWMSVAEEYDSSWARELAQHPVYASQIWESVRHELADELSDELKSLKDAGFDVSLAVHFGDPAEELIRAANSDAFDLVVMATHGRSGLQRALMGSVAEKLMRRASVPVMMLRPVDKAVAAT